MFGPVGTGRLEVKSTMTQFARFELAVLEDDSDLNTRSAGLAEHDDGTGKLIIFQSQLSGYSAQDARLGQDSYCVVNEDGATVYGGVLSCLSDGSTLKIAFSAQAAEVLECDSNLVCELPVVDESFFEGLLSVLRSGNPGTWPEVNF